MVGVAGKSKACNACRARKVGCDLQSPECGQCVKRGKQCPGYRRETIFLSHNTVNRTTSQNPGSSRPPSAATASVPQAKTGCIQKEQDETVVRKPIYRGPRLRAQVHNQYAFRDLFIADLLEIFLPQKSASAAIPTSWLQIVVNIPTPGEALNSAMSALSLAVVGRARNNPALSVESARKYGMALWELQKALWDDDLMYNDQTLAACMTLVLYEIYECPAQSLKGWVFHSQGMSRLIEARGPEMHQSPLAHELYKEYRYMTMMQTLATRKASFVHESRWSTVPWEGIDKTADQKLYDLGSELSKILANADASKLIADPQRLLSEKLTLISQCQNLDSRFEKWFSDLEAEIPAPRYWPRFSNIENPVDKLGHEKVFPVSFEFLNLQTAKILLDYWFLLILLYSTILITYRTLAGSAQTGESQHRPEHPADSQRAKARISPDRKRLPLLAEKYKPPSLFVLASNIAQSMEYMMSKDTGVLGSSWAFFALKAAMQCYRYRPGRELQWLQETLDRVSTNESPRLGPVYALANWSDTSQAKSSLETSPC